MARLDPNRPDFSPYGFSCVRWTPTTMSRCDRHNEIELNLLEGGSLVYLMGGQKVTVVPREIPSATCGGLTARCGWPWARSVGAGAEPAPGCS